MAVFNLGISSASIYLSQMFPLTEGYGKFQVIDHSIELLVVDEVWKFVNYWKSLKLIHNRIHQWMLVLRALNLKSFRLASALNSRWPISFHSYNNFESWSNLFDLFSFKLQCSSSFVPDFSHLIFEIVKSSELFAFWTNLFHQLYDCHNCWNTRVCIYIREDDMNLYLIVLVIVVNLSVWCDFNKSDNIFRMKLLLLMGICKERNAFHGNRHQNISRWKWEFILHGSSGEARDEFIPRHNPKRKI